MISINEIKYHYRKYRIMPEVRRTAMRESIHKYFRVGTIQWMSYPQRDPMESLKEICKDDFFDAIEVKGYGDRNEEAKSFWNKAT